MHRTVWKRTTFILLFIIFLLYASILIYQSSFVIAGTRYFSLFDDEMISMRYGRNLAHGLGLVWNGGERVEGITNPLWTGYMALIHLFPIPIEKISLVIQLTNLFFLTITLLIVKKIADVIAANSFFVSTVSVLFVAFYFPLQNWTVILGTEVGILTLLITLIMYLNLISLQHKRFTYLIYLLLGILTLIRLDMVFFCVILITYFLLTQKKLRKKHLRVGIPLFVFFLITQTILRLWYYHELLPNTYYLKLTGYPFLLRIARGFYVSTKFINWILVLLPLLSIIKRKQSQIFPLLIAFFTQIIYSVYVGGDAWEFYGGSNRYITPVMPLFFIAFIATGHHVFTTLKIFVTKRYHHTYTIIGGIMLLLSFISFNSQTDDMLAAWLLIRTPPTVGENAFQVRMAHEITRITTPHATVGIVWAGVVPYFADRTYIDLFGKSEKIIARGRMHREFFERSGKMRNLISFYPGHMKWDYHYALTNYHPDLIAQVFPYTEAQPYLSSYDRYLVDRTFDFHIRQQTTNVHWKKFSKEKQAK